MLDTSTAWRSHAKNLVYAFSKHKFGTLIFYLAYRHLKKAQTSENSGRRYQERRGGNRTHITLFSDLPNFTGYIQLVHTSEIEAKILANRLASQRD
jgi:hypothetical protein